MTAAPCRLATGSAYVGVIYERRLGGSARLAEAEGRNVGGWSVRGGLRFWF